MSSDESPKRAWYRDLNRYHWFVLGVACMGWMFDTMAQQLFNLARKPALRDLLGGHASASRVDEQGAIATAVFMVGWALGGVLFGVLGDRLGRAKTMMLTILCYTIFTGLSVFSTGVVDFDVYRFLCGLGVGGQFSVGVALVAEVVPASTRPFALGMVQAFSTVGNMIAALTVIGLGRLEQAGIIHSAWRYIFLAGACPHRWHWWSSRNSRSRSSGSRRAPRRCAWVPTASYSGDPRWRRNAIAGLLLAFAGVVGLWGIGFFSYDLLRPALEKSFRAQGLTGADLAGRVTMWIGVTSLLQNLGGFFGVHAFTYLTQYTGRKKAFAASFLAAMLMTAYTFWNLKDIGDIFWMIPLMGFTQLALFGGYAIYLPELFPTRLRSTGTSFCYNVGRFAAAAGPFTLGQLTGKVFAGYAEPMRYAGVSMCLVFLVGLAALPLAPETKGKPLPE